MKKLIALALAVVALLCCLVGCSEGDKYSRERFYGVVRFSEESNQLVVYIPSIGDVVIPESDGCCSCCIRQGNTKVLPRLMLKLLVSSLC